VRIGPIGLSVRRSAVRLPPALEQRDFRSLWLAGLISDAGDWMLLVALPIVVYGLTGSALGTSIAFLAELAPGILLAPVAGRLADRADRRRLMLTITTLQALSLLPLLLV
jgi:MFS family permease